MPTTTTEPIRTAIAVAVPRATAFEVFTARMGSWWNPGHSIGSSPFEDVVIEPHVGGRWFERSADGVECDWGRVLVWQPDDRVVLDWQITADWSFDPDLHTEVEVTFTAEDPDRTLVQLVHRGLDAYGDRAQAVRGIFDSPGGWPGLLDRFAERSGSGR